LFNLYHMSSQLVIFFIPMYLLLRSRLSPYTTLFRSRADEGVDRAGHLHRGGEEECGEDDDERRRHRVEPAALDEAREVGAERRRSEEHTSELQSRENLVCRLLLEKKKTKKNITIATV